MGRGDSARWDLLGRVIGALREPALLVAAEERRIAHSNLAAEQLLGARSPLGDRSLDSLLVDAQQRGMLGDRLQDGLAARGLVELEGLRLRGASAPPLIVDATAIPVVDGEPRGWILLLRGASAATDRAVERVLAQRMTTVAQLAADVAHKLHNLSTAVLAGLGQLRVELEASGAEPLDGLDALQEVVPKCDAIVDRFVDLCRRHGLAAGAFDVSETVASVATLLEHTLPASLTLAWERDGWPSALFAHGDPELARQVVLGCALALRRALFEGGMLRFDVRRPEPAREEAPTARRCCITLRAWPTAHLPTALADELRAVREVLAPVGGLLEVAADAPRQALEVRLSFSVDTGTAERERLASGGHGERVVLVAPESYVTQVMLAALRTAGYAAEQASGPAALRAALAASRPALVILDDSAGAVVECVPLLAEDQATLLLVGAEPTITRDAGATMTVCRPFQLADIGAWVARLLAGGGAP